MVMKYGLSVGASQSSYSFGASTGVVPFPVDSGRDKTDVALICSCFVCDMFLSDICMTIPMVCLCAAGERDSVATGQGCPYGVVDLKLEALPSIDLLWSFSRAIELQTTWRIVVQLLDTECFNCLKFCDFCQLLRTSSTLSVPVC